MCIDGYPIGCEIDRTDDWLIGAIAHSATMAFFLSLARTLTHIHIW